jgi:hypothetical protein
LSAHKENALRRLLTTLTAALLLTSSYAHGQGNVLPLPPQDQQDIIARLGAHVVGNALPSQTIEKTSVYFPLHNKALNYQVTSGPKSGTVEQLGVAQVRRSAGTPAWRFQLSPTLAGFIRETADGDLIMPAVNDAGEGVVVVTTPANPFVLKGMKPGETRSYTQHVAVSHLDDPSDQEYSGTLNGSYTYVGTYQVTVPAGTYNAILLRTKCEGKVGPAHTEDRAYYFFAPNVGVVAMISQEDATAFWIIHLDSSTGKVLAAQ